jgi:uncharacterized membrane protein HdeD (DUF308 family)
MSNHRLASLHDGSRAAPLLHTLADNWWLLMLRGIAAIAFGILAFIWPGLTLLTLVFLYALYAVIDGALALWGAMTGGQEGTSRWWLAAVGVVGLVVGLLAAIWPGITAFILIAIIGASALIRGVIEIFGAIELRKEIEHEWFLILSGVLSVIFGLFVLFRPGAGAVALVWLIALYAIAIGVVTVVLSLRLRTFAAER